jgi:hypothetical protein
MEDSFSLFRTVTISAESDSGFPAWFCIGIRMTDEAICIHILMPFAVDRSHKTEIMGLRICSLEPVEVDMAGNAIGIGSLRIVAGHTTLYVSFRQRGVRSAAAADADRGKSGRFMACRYNAAKRYAAVQMTIAAEFLIAMAGLAIRRFSFCFDAVGKPEIHAVHRFAGQRLRFVITVMPR